MPTKRHVQRRQSNPFRVTPEVSNHFKPPPTCLFFYAIPIRATPQRLNRLRFSPTCLNCLRISIWSLRQRVRRNKKYISVLYRSHVFHFQFIYKVYLQPSSRSPNIFEVKKVADFGGNTMSNLIRNTVPRITRNMNTAQGIRKLGTTAKVSKPKPEGDISAVFVSLSSKEAVSLPSRFKKQKNRLISGHEEQLKASWDKLLDLLKDEVAMIKEKGTYLSTYQQVASICEFP